MQTGPEGKSKGSWRKKAKEKDQMQQKHLPFTIKSSYGKIAYVEKKKTKVTPLHSVVSSHSSFSSSRLRKVL